MVSSNGPVFECRVATDVDSFGPVREFLESFKEDHAGDPGFAEMRIFSDAGQRDVTLQIAFENNERVDKFLSGAASVLEAGLHEATGQRAVPASRLLREDAVHQTSASTCLNCGTALRGQYCAQCGQRSQSRLISLWELVRDAFGDLFELDSRLWQTLRPLVFRPGDLTADYLQGKRARYMPPFRMYLVLSLLFFVVAFFDPTNDLPVLFVEDPGSVSETMPDDEPADAESPLKVTINGEAVEDLDTDAGDCDFDQASIDTLPKFLSQRFTANRLNAACRNIEGDDGVKLGEEVLDNIPAALVVLLPIMALVLKLLYPLSRRFYVEHVLFVVHFHAFFFLVLTLQFVWDRLISAIGLHEAISVVPIIIVSFYIPVYLFKAMRCVYQQGFVLTFIKYSALLFAYLTGFSLLMVAVIAIAAFSLT